MYTDKSMPEMEKLFSTRESSGLSEEEAGRRKEKYGENCLKNQKKKSVAAFKAQSPGEERGKGKGDRKPSVGSGRRGFFGGGATGAG